jgi:pyruvate/2-oxoglutarate dehydrogenase complex dihydrolipoamide dehydrogenase (E3) component
MASEYQTSTPNEAAQFMSALDAEALVRSLRANVEIKDRKYRMQTYEKCFVGSEACAWMIDAGIASDADQAVLIGNMLLNAGMFHHVLKEHAFKNERLFYRFAEDEGRGAVKRKPGGAAVSWLVFVNSGWNLAGENESLLSKIPSYHDELAQMDRVESWGIEPLDEHNARLLDNVHPREWTDPKPRAKYNLVVVGAGSGGLVTAAAAAGLGAEVALIEEHLLGGDCLNVGCVPSKALISAAKAAARVRRAESFGVRIDGIEPGGIASKVRVDFAQLMERLRRLRADISGHDSAKRFTDLGIDVYIGRATFTGENSVEVNGTTLAFARCCIATGVTPAIPPIPGLGEAPFHTNMNIFNLTRLPPRLGVMGTGAIGIELAQAFQRFGSQVTVMARSDRILPKEDQDAAEIVQSSLQRDGVTILFDCNYRKVRHRPSERADDFPTITVVLGDREYEFDALLVATGRKPNVDGLNLESAKVRYDPAKGIEVNERLQTSNENVFAVGDVATKYQFTHVSDFMARMVVRNALFFGRDKFSNLLIPWCTYTDPEVAHVGLYEHDLDERGIKYKTFTRRFAEVDRAIVEGETDGFVRVHVKQGTDQILGASIVHPHAGDMISEITLAMQSKTGLGSLANVIHPYPT